MPTGFKGLAGLAAVGALAFAAPALADVNVLPTHTVSVEIQGNDGVLRAGSPWGPGSSPVEELQPIDGVFQPEFQQWNDHSFWWDADPSVNSTEVTYTINLDQAYTFDRFVVQADDNDTYQLEYWNGSAWQDAYDVPTLPSFGLRTRDSGQLAPITTTALLFHATGGDNYFGVSEIQAFAVVPEPATWATAILGFGLAGAALRRRRWMPLAA